VEQSNRVLRFLSADGPAGATTGSSSTARPWATEPDSPGLVAMAATAGLAADPGRGAGPSSSRLWKMEAPSGHYRYYNGLLYMLALLEVGGRFRAYMPKPGPH
jgi:oligosaccharide reducing-end xylanase